jgi:hypothetical protein
MPRAIRGIFMQLKLTSGFSFQIIICNFIQNQYMKYFSGVTLFFIFSIAVPAITFSQNTGHPKSQFIGLFVNNFDSTLSWYTNKIGFKVIKKEEVPSAGIKFAMLEWNGFSIEMIQNPKVVKKTSLDSVIKNNAGAEGFFKLGFYVDDINYWENHFKSKEVKFRYPMMSNSNFNWKYFIIEDPEKNLIQFYTFVKPG